MKGEKIIYYNDELNDEFSKAKIVPKLIDEKYRYNHGQLWECVSCFMQNFLSMPIKILYSKIVFKINYIGKEKLKKYKDSGYFVYVNHTQPFADTFIPSLAIFSKRNFFIANPENVSMKFLKNTAELLGAIPIPTNNNKKAIKNFFNAIEKRIKCKNSITIYPEAHIWPYYTKIRPFKAVSFRYPIELNVPVFCMTNTYQRYGKKNNRVKIITYIDGPFFPNETLTKKEQRQDLRDKVYNQMVKRSKKSNIEYIKYKKM